MIFGNEGRQGWVGNIIVGLVGAVIGGFLGNLLFDVDVIKWSIEGFLVSVAGALILLFAMRKLS
jgi:uncharacterized membrane protein YeaQ/YmgE (transglycosylase-associated protein family)